MAADKLEASASTPAPNLRFEFKKIGFDKVLLLVLALVAVFTNRWLEDYKAKQSWVRELSTQRIIAVRDLSEAASTLENRHRNLVDVMRQGLATTDPTVQTAIRDQNEASDHLSSKCQSARALLPDEIVTPVERFNDAVFAASPQGEAATAALTRITTARQDAQSRLMQYIRPLLADGASAPASVPCTPPVAETKGTDQVLETMAAFSGKFSGRVSRAWFDFDETPALKFSVVAVDGHGFANGLKPGVTYYYRFVAQNPCGTSVGAVRVFTTPQSSGAHKMP